MGFSLVTTPNLPFALWELGTKLALHREGEVPVEPVVDALPFPKFLHSFSCRVAAPRLMKKWEPLSEWRRWYEEWPSRR